MAKLPVLRGTGRDRSTARLKTQNLGIDKFATDPEFFSMSWQEKTLAHVNAWQSDNDNRVTLQIAGLPVISHSAAAVVNGNSTGGRTYLANLVYEQCSQDGVINQVRMWVGAIGDVGGWKFQIYRPNGANFDFIASSEAVTPVGTGEQTFRLASPLPCRQGDILAVWIPKGTTVQNTLGTTVRAGSTIKYVIGNPTGANINFDQSVAAYSLSIAGFSDTAVAPYLAVTGDSIPEGHNCGAQYHSYLDGGPLGTITSEIMYRLRGMIGIGSELQYLNACKGGQTFAWVLSTGIPACHAVRPKYILIHCGVNDINTVRTWAQVKADLDAIKAQLTTEKLLIDEILPWSGTSDAIAASIRSFNVNFAMWCMANNAVLVKCHDEMGQIRGTTQQLDDLITNYNQDNLHVTQPGVDKMAQIWKRYI